jgi:hypothetical protein
MKDSTSLIPIPVCVLFAASWAPPKLWLGLEAPRVVHNGQGRARDCESPAAELGVDGGNKERRGGSVMPAIKQYTYHAWPPK